MAAAPGKSPLHNFPLPFLKWGTSSKNHASASHRSRKPISAESSPVADHCELDSERNESEPEATARTDRVRSRTVRNRFSFTSSSLVEKSQKQQLHSGKESKESDEGRERKRKEGDEAEAEEAVQKPWNLRPRKGLFMKVSGSLKNGELIEPEGLGGGSNGHHVSENQNQQPKSMRLRGIASESQIVEKEKRKFWIALSRDEIEEDIFVMTGSRPARRPKKHPKNVQKQLETVFPGSWLVGITAEAYRIADAPAKR